MSILDRFRGSAKKAKEQAEHVVEQHGDKIASGVEKTGEAVSKVTGHRFDDKIDKGVSKAKERLEGDNGSSASQPDTPAAPPPADDAGSEPDKGTSA